MAFNPDHSWQFNNPAPGLFAALGCNGRGVVLATLYGRDLARHAAGIPTADLTLPVTPMKRVPFHALTGAGVVGARTWWRALDARDMRRARA
jgi:glycine/D-amino acid oxidase-like deaminating enzyme